MFDLFLYATALQAMTNINTNLDTFKKNTYEYMILVEHPGIKYEKFCVDKVQYLKFDDNGQTIIVPHFRTDNSVVVCR